TLNANGSFSYTPAANYNGADSFTYKPNDGTVDGNTVTVGLTVTPVNDAPVGVADSYTTLEDTTLNIAAAGVLANDTDVEGSALSAVLVTGPAHGTLTLNANGSFSYTPSANYNGADSFTYKPNDGTADGNTVTVSLTVTPVNDAPVAVADSYTTAEDTTLNIAAAGVLANDTDVEGSALSAVLVSGPAHGTLTLNPNGSFSYTPAANYNGADSFTYKPNDGTADGNTVTVSLTITPVNDAPVAVADSYTTAEDTTLTIAAAGVLANDTDVDGSALSAVLVSGPAHGTLSLNADGSFNYTPAANYNGADSFTYKPNDGTADGNTVTVSLTVTPVNDAPVGVADSYTTAEDTTLTIAAAGVLANDTDVDGNALSAVLVAGPTHGSLTLNANGSFSYTPAANYNGADSFTYKPNDGTADGNTVTVSLTVTPVNDAPVAVADSYSLVSDTTLTIAAAGVLANDTDVDGNALSAVLVAGPVHGSLTLNADGSFAYTPTAGYSGGDSFTYKPNDGSADGNTVTVALTVTPANIAPVGTNDSYTTSEDNTLNVAAAGVLSNDTDADGNPLTAVLVAGPAHGSLTLNANGSFSYTPAANYNGADSFTYTPNDGIANGNTVTVSLTVTPVNDAPVGVADSYTSAEDTTLTIAAVGVLSNDTDVDGNTLSAVLVSGPAHGTLTLNANGSFSYTPTANYNGADSFTYKPNDGTVNGNTVTVSLTITPVNDVPVAVADSYTTNEDTALNIAGPGVLANDTDIDGNALSAVLVTGPAHGTLSLNADGSFNYTPTANYNGADSFTYKPNDGTADGNTVTVSLTVTAVNDLPVATADSYSTNEDTVLTVSAPGVLANDTDVEGSALTSALVSGPAHGLVTLNANGSFSYTPFANYNGTDSFTYKANDGTADGNTATVSLTINPVNDAPVVSAGNTLSYTENAAATAISTGLTLSDVDSSTLSSASVGITGNFAAGQDVLSFTNTAQFTGSFDSGTGVLSLTLNAAQTATLADWQSALRSVSYSNTSDSPSTLARTITFTADDGAAAQHIGTATATVNVAAVNDAPTAAAPADTSIGTAFSHTDLAITGLSVADVDAGGGNVTATVSSLHAGLTFTTAGLAGSTGIGTHTVTLTGTVAQVNTALATLVYNSDDGFTGSDSVTLSVNDNGNSGSGGALGSAGSTFHVGVVPQVFIIDNTGGGSGGTGTSANPFKTIADFNASAATGSGDYIYVRQGTGTYSEADGINLKASEHLYGQGQTLSFTNPVTGVLVTIGTGSVGAAPTISVTGAGQHGIDLSTDNQITGLNVATTLGNQIGIHDNGAAVGNLSIADVDVTGVGKAVNIVNGGTLSVAIDTLTSTGSSAQGVALSGNATALSGSFTVAGGAISGSTSQGFQIGDGVAGHGGTIAVSDAGTIAKTTAGNVVDVEGHTSGAIVFSGVITTSGAVANGILVNNNTGGSVTFSAANNTLSTGAGNAVSLTNNTGAAIGFTGGGLALTTTSGIGFNATGGGTVNVTGATNTITSATGTGLNIVNTTIAASHATFQSISSGAGTTAGIVLDGTGASGGLHITGIGTTAGSGGTIANKTGGDILTGTDAGGQTTSGTQGVGIFLHNTLGASFSNMQLNNFSNFAVYGNNVTGFALDHSVINGANGSTNAGDREEGSVRFDNLLGTASITNSTISGGFTQNVDLYNTSGTLSRLTMDSNTFGLVNATNGNDNVLLQVFNSATANLTVTNSNFLGTRADFIAALANNNGTMDVVARNNTFHNGQAIVPGGGTAVDVRSGSAGNVSAATTTFDISHNTDTDGGANAFDTVGIFVAKGQDNGTLTGTIASNSLVAKTASNSDGIFVRAAGNSGTLTTLIQNNTITNWGNAGIHIQNNDGSATVNASIFGNSVTAPGATFPFAALFVDNGATATDHSITNLVIGSANAGEAAKQNTFVGGSNAVADVELSNFNAGTFLNLSRNGSASGTAALVVADDNVGTPSVDTTGGSGTTSLVNTLPTLPPAVAPLQLAPGGVGSSGHPSSPSGLIEMQLTQADIDAVLASAIARWEATGLTAAQTAALHSVSVTVGDLGGTDLGLSTPGHITLDATALGHGWFVDSTPNDDAEFTVNSAGTLYTAPDQTPAGHVDLLTAVMHELGHQIGLEDNYAGSVAGDVMYGYIADGSRRLPMAGEANGAVPGSVGEAHAVGAVMARSDNMGHATDTDQAGRLQHVMPDGGPAIVSVATLLSGNADATFDHVAGGGLDFSGLNNILSGHPGVEQIVVLSATVPNASTASTHIEGWKAAVISTLDFATDHSLGSLLAHLDQGSAGFGGSTAGAGQPFHGQISAPDFNSVDLGPQIDFRQDPFGHLDHAVL
ncbi:MAG: Ig-like domain-containing protein, partial [Pseudomonadota bacterium]